MRKITASILGLGIASLMAACASGEKTQQGNMSNLDPAKFDSTINGKKTALYTLTNGDMEVCITNFGGRVVSIMTPDKDGKPTDVVQAYSAILITSDS